MNDSPWNPAIVGTCRVCGAPVETSTDGVRADVACSKDGGHNWWEARPGTSHALGSWTNRPSKGAEPHP